MAEAVPKHSDVTSSVQSSGSDCSNTQHGKTMLSNRGFLAERLTATQNTLRQDYRLGMWLPSSKDRSSCNSMNTSGCISSCDEVFTHQILHRFRAASTSAAQQQVVFDLTARRARHLKIDKLPTGPREMQASPSTLPHLRLPARCGNCGEDAAAKPYYSETPCREFVRSSVFPAAPFHVKRLFHYLVLVFFTLNFAWIVARDKSDNERVTTRFSGFFAHASNIAHKKEVSLDSHVEDIAWCGADHRVVLLKTRKGRLYRSADGGRTWKEITEVVKPPESSGGASETGGGFAVESVMVSPVDKTVVLIVGTKRNHFMSEDSGATFRRLKYRGAIHNFHFHPTRRSWAVLSTWTDACYQTPGGGAAAGAAAAGAAAGGSIGGGGAAGDARQQDCNHQLFYTKDLGRTFNQVADYVVQFSWGDKKVGNEDFIFFTQHRGRIGHQPRYGGWSKNVDLMYTPDLGVTIERLVYRGNKFLVSNGYFFVAKVKDAARQSVSLLVSTDGGKTFQVARLPVEIEEKSYTVLDTSENAIMLHVNHGHNRAVSDTGNVYISDAKGVRYSLSLPNNIRTSTGECEFDRVLSLEGVYIANYKDSVETPAAGAESLLFSSSAEDVEGSSGGGAAGSSNRSGDAAAAAAAEARARLQQEQEEAAEGVQVDVEKKHRSATSRSRKEEVIRTVISFDKGGVWSFLKAPKVDSRGQKIDCPPDRCWLHLNGITRFSEYAPFYSVDSAVGIIMGTGNVGSYLRSEKEAVNTYLSRDGGVTWIEAHKGAFIYEMGDHGGLLVMADDTKKTTQVVFSWNEGHSWFDFELGTTPLFVDNIVIEPNASSVEFLLYGKREADPAGVLFHLDFAALDQQPCKGIWAADSVSSDYETWSPSDGRSGNGEKCILGKHITYTRRKQTSECFNGRDFDRPKVYKVCPCTIEDYECEFGFSRAVGATECLPTDAAAAAAATAAGLSEYADPQDIAAAAACTSSSFFYTPGYRKVPGDVCQGGWVPEKVAVPCPPHSPVSRGGKVVLLLLLLIILLTCTVNYLAKTGKLRKFFRNAGFESFANVPYGLIGGGGAFPTAGWSLDDEGGVAGGRMQQQQLRGSSGTSPHSSAAFGEEELGVRCAATPAAGGELGFIDAEQDENEDDAPTLMTYSHHTSATAGGYGRSRGEEAGARGSEQQMAGAAAAVGSHVKAAAAAKEGSGERGRGGGFSRFDPDISLDDAGSSSSSSNQRLFPMHNAASREAAAATTGTATAATSYSTASAVSPVEHGPIPRLAPPHFDEGNVELL